MISTGSVSPQGFPEGDQATQFAVAVGDLLARHCDSAALRTAWESPECRVPGLWQRLHQIGLFDLAADGLGALPMLVPAVIVTGRHALPEPILGNLAVGVSGLRHSAGLAPDEVIAIASSTHLPASSAHLATRSANPRTGAEPLVLDATVADAFVSEGGVVHSAAEVTLAPCSSIDRAARLGIISMEVDDPPDHRGIRGDHNLQRDHSIPADHNDLVFDVAALLAAAQLQGLGEGMLAQAVEYASVREQFGQPIGAFQAIKHHLANVYIGLAFSRPILDDAARCLAQGGPDASARVSHAKWAVTDAALQSARVALQVHGAIGYTYEHDLHIWTKKVWTLSTVWGDGEFHRRRVEHDFLDEGEVRDIS